jgi:hypothetical protein
MMTSVMCALRSSAQGFRFTLQGTFDHRESVQLRRMYDGETDGRFRLRAKPPSRDASSCHRMQRAAIQLQPAAQSPPRAAATGCMKPVAPVLAPKPLWEWCTRPLATLAIGTNVTMTPRGTAATQAVNEAVSVECTGPMTRFYMFFSLTCTCFLM